MEAISTLELQEFEATPRRKKDKNRKRRPSKHQEEPDSNPLGTSGACVWNLMNIHISDLLGMAAC